MSEKISRNEPCPCGSGKKYKQCCIGLSQPRKRKFKAVVLSQPSKTSQSITQLPNLMDRTFGSIVEETNPHESLLVTEMFPEVTPAPKGLVSSLEPTPPLE